jgi:hypothetical protein
MVDHTSGSFAFGCRGERRRDARYRVEHAMARIGGHLDEVGAFEPDQREREREAGPAARYHHRVTRSGKQRAERGFDVARRRCNRARQRIDAIEALGPEKGAHVAPLSGAISSRAW